MKNSKVVISITLAHIFLLLVIPRVLSDGGGDHNTDAPAELNTGFLIGFFATFLAVVIGLFLYMRFKGFSDTENKSL